MSPPKNPFYFVGKGPLSKSLLLRALIVKSYFPDFQIKGDSHCDDVRYMKKALKKIEPISKNLSPHQHTLNNKKAKTRTENHLLPNTYSPMNLDCGLSAATLRFLALRVAREPDLKAKGNQTRKHTLAGHHKIPYSHFSLKGHPALFKRPHQELTSLLGQLSCLTKWESNTLHIKTKGWKLTGSALTLFSGRSSQFASSVLLNSWLGPFDLSLSLEGPLVSSSYLQMTLSLIRSLGMDIKISSPESQITSSVGREYYIPAGQKPKLLSYEPEQDMSALFALSAMTVAGGQTIFTNWPKKSLQPDFIFPTLLKKMGFQVTETNESLKITKGPLIHPITYNMKDGPDLFPVLSAICALSRGESRLHGAPHLRYKESDRIQKVVELLTKVGKKTRILKDGLSISGPLPDKKSPTFDFDPAGDHRMAMAGAVLKKAGYNLRILNAEVVNKSFPDFWSSAKLNPIDTP